MKKVKNILFKLDLEGNGIVNNDSETQRYIHNEAKNHLQYYNKNIMYAKKNFYGTVGEDDFRYKVKISSDCLKKDMFGDDAIAHTSKISHHDNLLYSYIASPMCLSRGYMDANNKNEVLKMSGPINLIDAEQTCDAMSVIETFSKAGEKISNTGDTDKSDNTFFHKETVGKIEYGTKGNFDLKEMQFVSCDQILGRYAFNPDKFDLYKTFMNMRMPNFNSELGYFKLDGSVLDVPEYGFKLSKENIVFLIKYNLEKLLGIDIRRRGSYAKTSKLKVKLVENPLVDTYESEDNWITINGLDDIENLDFDVKDYYVETSLEMNKVREEMQSNYETYNKESSNKAKSKTKKKVIKDTKDE